MLQGEHSAILSTFIKLPFVIKIFVLSIFECPFEGLFYTGFTVVYKGLKLISNLVTVLKRSPSSRADQQAQLLRERMQEYKTAAFTAKKNGDIELAKKYLRMAKVQ